MTGLRVAGWREDNRKSFVRVAEDEMIYVATREVTVS